MQGSPEQLLPRAVKLAAAAEVDPHSGGVRRPSRRLKGTSLGIILRKAGEDLAYELMSSPGELYPHGLVGRHETSCGHHLW